MPQVVAVMMPCESTRAAGHQGDINIMKHVHRHAAIKGILCSSVLLLCPSGISTARFIAGFQYIQNDVLLGVHVREIFSAAGCVRRQHIRHGKQDNADYAPMHLIKGCAPASPFGDLA